MVHDYNDDGDENEDDPRNLRVVPGIPPSMLFLAAGLHVLLELKSVVEVDGWVLSPFVVPLVVVLNGHSTVSLAGPCPPKLSASAIGLARPSILVNPLRSLLMLSMTLESLALILLLLEGNERYVLRSSSSSTT